MDTISVDHILGSIAIAVSVYLIFSLYFRKGFAENYVRTNPSAYIWRKWLGVERTVTLSKWFFGPLAILIVLLFTYTTRIGPVVDQVQYVAHEALFFPSVPLGEGLALFEDMGFFEELADLSFNEKITYLRAHPFYEYLGDDYMSSDLIEEPVLLAFDNNRVWWSDTERDVIMGADAYVEVLHEWSYISQGLFTTIDVYELWGSPNGPIALTVELQDTTIELHPEYLDDYVDVSILADINEHIAQTGYAYYMYEPFDQTALVFFLTEEQVLALVDRGWRLVHMTRS